MARIRTIKPEITESETLAELPLEVCWSFACLWPHCDDRGRRKAQPRLVKADLYPMRDDVTADDVTEHLTLLAEADLICLYTGCDGKPYLHVVNWDEHQKVDKPSQSRIPPCREHEADATCGVSKDHDDCASSPFTLGLPSETPASPLDIPASPPETPSPGPRTLDLVPRTVDHGSRTTDLATVAPSRKGREPDPIWDSLMAVCGVDQSSITDSMRGGYNKAVADLKRVGASPPEILRRSENYRAQFPDAALTPNALAKQWAQCDSGPPPKRATSDTRVSETLALAQRFREAGQ